MKERTAVKSGQYKDYLFRKRMVLVVLFVLTVAAAVIYIGTGTMKICLKDILLVFAGSGQTKHATAIYNVRLPRVLAGLSVGAVLAASGAVMQCVLRNPLASASTLGVSQGAAFGAALGIIVFGGGAITSSAAASTVSVNNPYIVTACAFIFGSLSSLVVICISTMRRSIGAGGLVLAGTALSAMFSGGSTLLQFFADDTALGAVVFWTFGNLGSASWRDILVLSAVMLVSICYYLWNSWNYNALEAGSDYAKSLGVNTRAVMLTSMAVCSLSAAVAVSFVGIIGFIGLIAPHIARRFVGCDHRYLIPASAFAGAFLLVIADLVAKTVLSPVILPIGALMSFVGGPVFLILLFKGGRHRD